MVNLSDPDFKDDCTGDEFKCKNGKCIYGMLVCDGLNHCGDNSDENNCTKGNLAEGITGSTFVL